MILRNPLLQRHIAEHPILTTADGKAIPVQLDQDGLWQYKNLAMLDFEDGTSSCSNGNAGMHKQVTGTVPAGSYTGLRFTVGVPFELDHIYAASAPSPLNMTAMFWSWQGGYKFVKAEILLVKPLPVVAADPPETGMSVPAAHEEALTQAEGHAPGGSVPGKTLATGMKPRVRSNGFPVHLGSTGCASASPTKAPVKDCVHPNRPVIVFDTFDVANNTVVFDMAQLLKNVDLSVAPPKGSGPGCMSFPEMAMCKKVMPAFGLPSGDVTEVVQTVFSREAKQ
jgi:hypothetical protein